MRGELPLEKLGLLAIIMFMTAVGVQIITSLESQFSERDLKIDDAYPSIGYDYCSEFRTGENVSKEEFFRIVYYRLKGSCELPEQEVSSQFVLKKEMLEEKTREFGLEDSSGDLLLFYRDNCGSANELELEGLVLGMEEQEFLVRPGDQLDVKGLGKEVVVC